MHIIYVFISTKGSDYMKKKTFVSKYILYVAWFCRKSSKGRNWIMRVRGSAFLLRSFLAAGRIVYIFLCIYLIIACILNYEKKNLNI